MTYAQVRRQGVVDLVSPTEDTIKSYLTTGIQQGKTIISQLYNSTLLVENETNSTTHTALANNLTALAYSLATRDAKVTSGQNLNSYARFMYRYTSPPSGRWLLPLTTTVALGGSALRDSISSYWSSVIEQELGLPFINANNLFTYLNCPTAEDVIAAVPSLFSEEKPLEIQQLLNRNLLVGRDFSSNLQRRLITLDLPFNFPYVFDSLSDTPILTSYIESLGDLPIGISLHGFNCLVMLGLLDVADSIRSLNLTLLTEISSIPLNIRLDIANKLSTVYDAMTILSSLTVWEGLPINNILALIKLYLLDQTIPPITNYRIHFI